MNFTEEQQRMKRRQWLLSVSLNHYFRGRISHALLWEVYLAYGYPAECQELRACMLRRV
jgi:hypothetical protein